MRVIAFPERTPPIGGPGTFQRNMAAALGERGYRVTHSGEGLVPDVIIVVGGTRHLEWILACKRKGAKVLQRLDGVNWRHRVESSGAWDRGLAELRNRLMGFTRDRVAGIVVYQSEFVASVWRSAYGWEPGRGRVIWNGTPWTEELADERLSSAGGMWRCRVVVVEGTIQADAATRSIIEGLSRWTQCDPLEREVEVIGRADKRLAGWVENLAGIRYRGPVGREDVKEALLRGDVFVPLEVNPPCPNSVVEALALGTPVVGFDTGALGELVDAGGGGGVTAPYGANPWALEEPWIPALLEALDNALSRKEVLRTRALAASRQWLSMDRMVSAYEEAMTQLVGT